MDYCVRSWGEDDGWNSTSSRAFWRRTWPVVALETDQTEALGTELVSLLFDRMDVERALGELGAELAESLKALHLLDSFESGHGVGVEKGHGYQTEENKDASKQLHDDDYSSAVGLAQFESRRNSEILVVVSAKVIDLRESVVGRPI